MKTFNTHTLKVNECLSTSFFFGLFVASIKNIQQNSAYCEEKREVSFKDLSILIEDNFSITFIVWDNIVYNNLDLDLEQLVQIVEMFHTDYERFFFFIEEYKQF